MYKEMVIGDRWVGFRPEYLEMLVSPAIGAKFTFVVGVAEREQLAQTITGIGRGTCRLPVLNVVRR